MLEPGSGAESAFFASILHGRKLNEGAFSPYYFYIFGGIQGPDFCLRVVGLKS